MSVYLIQAGVNGPVKIGQSDDPMARLAQLQTSHYEKLRLVGLILDGSESELHAKYADQRLNGEWFTASAELLAEVTLTAESYTEFVDALTTFQKALNAIVSEARRGRTDKAMFGLLSLTACITNELERVGVTTDEHPVVDGVRSYIAETIAPALAREMAA